MEGILGLFLLFVFFHSNITIAAEDITGLWHGELSFDPGKEATFQFLIQKDLQEGESIPLTLRRFELSPLSDAEKEKLVGKWYGKDCPPGTIGGRGRYIFEFVADAGRNVTGGVKVFLPSGKLDPAHYNITEIVKSGDDIIFEISGMDSNFRGKIVGNKIVGELTSLRWTRSYTITKGEYLPDLNTKSNLTDSVVEFLSGRWLGKVAVKGNEQVYQFRMMFVFGKTEADVFKAYIIERDSFDEVNPITEASMNDNKLKLKTEDFEVQFEMKISGNTLTGEWNQ